MKKLFFLVFSGILIASFLFLLPNKTYAYNLCQSNGSWIDCGSWNCPTSWNCSCSPAWSYSSGGSSCSKNSTHPYGACAFSGHCCWFAKQIPFNSNCGSYNDPTLSISTTCNASYQSVVKFTWTSAKNGSDATGLGIDFYRVGWTQNSTTHTPVNINAPSSQPSSYSHSIVVPNNTAITWWVDINNGVPTASTGYFGRKTGPGITSKTCTAPTTTPTHTPTPGPTATPTPIPVTYVCSNSNWSCNAVSDGSGYSSLATCNNNCVAPPPPACPEGELAAFAPLGIPTGGLCIINRTIQLILNYLLIASIIITIIFLIWGGATWIMSSGDKQKLVQAKQRITLAFIGLVIIFVSFAILKILQLLFKVG